MKKISTLKKTFSVLLALFGLNVSAQISGIVTVNSAVATGGTNYQSFTALAAALNGAGINGPLTVNVAPGTTYSEQVIFTQITGMSATNTITVNGNGATIMFTATLSTAPHTWMYSGTDYMTVNNMTMVAQGTSYGLATHLWSDANYNTFSNCTFSVNINGISSTLVPFSISGSSTSGTGTGSTGGSNNTVDGCTISGGYYCCALYGNTAAPFSVNNKITNSKIVDYYVYGIYNYYQQNTLVKGCVLERINRTTTSTCYGIYFSTNSYGGTADGNHLRKLWNALPGNTNATYCLYSIVSAATGQEVVFKNNIVSDINSSGTIYGIMLSGGTNARAFHNTLVFDDQTNTGGTLYTAYNSGSGHMVMNNILYVTRAAGTKYMFYFTGASTFTYNNNVTVFTPTTGTNYYGYYSTTGINYTTMPQWQAATNQELNSVTTDPMFTNASASNFIPTNLAINNICPPNGVATDFNNTGRSPVTPDPGAFEIYTLTCNGTPGANSVITPTYAFCPGATVAAAVATTYTNSGYTYQWQTSTVSVVGPWTTVTGATLATFNSAPINVNTYISALVTCTTTNSQLIVPAAQVVISGVTLNNVPYYESFETLAQNKLPNCSWSATSFGSNSLTYTVSNNGGRIPRTGSNFASFSNSPAGTNAFYTNGLNLKAGITYSASVWYITDQAGSNNWTDLSILVGNSQSSTGQQTIATTGGPAIAAIHKPLSNTFTVPVTGVYYVAVRATSTVGGATYLSFDDLAVEIPCNLNLPALTVVPNFTTACSGAPLGLVASGADSYTWSTGSTSSSITAFPTPTTTSYYVSGTSTLTGCLKTFTQQISVSLSPQINIIGNAQACVGKPTTLTAVSVSQLQYNWSNGSNNASTVVNPTATTTYSVYGVNSIGCSTVSVLQVTVNPLPSINVNVLSNPICSGDLVTMAALGASNYQWTSGPTAIQFGNPLSTVLTSSKVYTVTGTDNKGCSNTAMVTIEVNECTGLNETNGSLEIKVFPNPTTNGFVTVNLNNSYKKVLLLDMTGRVLASENVDSSSIVLNMSKYSNGVYFVKAVSDKSSKIVKVVKQD